MDQRLSLEAELLRLWGPSTFRFVESILPRSGGEDLVARLKIGSGLQVSLQTDRGNDQPGDFNPKLQSFTKDEAEISLERIADFFPAEAFASVHVRAPLGRIAELFITERSQWDEGRKKDVEKWLEGTRSFGSFEGLYSALDEVARGEITIVFFRQPREALPEKAAAGWAIVCPLKSRARFDEIMVELDTQVREVEGRGVLKDLIYRKIDEVEIYEAVFAQGARNDARVERPGLAIVKDHLLLSNFLPIFEMIPDVLKKTAPAFSTRRGAFDALKHAPRHLRIAGTLDGPALHPYLEQSRSGWAYSRTSLTTVVYQQIRHEFDNFEAPKRGLTKGTLAYETAADEFVRAREARIQGERPNIIRDVEAHLRYFQGFVRSLGIFVEDTSSSATLSLRLELH